MKTIKDQINKIVEYKATTLSELSKEHDTLRERLVEGLDKMKAANVYSKEEIEEIRMYMYQVLNERYTHARNDVVNKLRAEFTF